MELYFFLPMIIFLGLITSHQDIKSGKIRNKWIVFAIAYSAVLNLIFFLMGYYDSHYLSKFFLNGLLALATGFLLWYLALWTAGDAKLFFSYSLLLPLSIYKFSNFELFPSFNILIYVFVPVSLYLVVYSTFKATKEQKLISLAQTFEMKNLLNLALFLFAVNWPVSLFFNYFGISNNFLFSTLIVFVAFLVTENLFNLNFKILLVIISIIRVVFDKNIFLLWVWIDFFLMFILLAVFRYLILNVAFGALTNSIRIEDLKEGMIPAETVYKEGREFKKRKLLNYSFFGILSRKSEKKEYMFKMNPEGLSKEEIESLKKIRHKLPYKTIRIQQALSFAPFLFLGVLIALILNYIYW